jgi:SAM-dependent methyltransferase
MDWATMTRTSAAESRHGGRKGLDRRRWQRPGTPYYGSVPDAYYLNPRNAARYERDMGRLSDTVDDIPFYVDLARQAAEQGHAVLELGCGTGRVTIPMALAGADVTGLDSSPAMLDIARAKAEGAGISVQWVEGDIAHFDLGERFGLVVIPFRSFLHLTRDDEQTGCLAAIHRHLTAGGRLALNFYVAPAGTSGGTRRSRVYRSMRLRDVSRGEMEGLLDAAGFEVEALHGWFDGREFGPESSEMVWLVRKRSTGGKY